MPSLACAGSSWRAHACSAEIGIAQSGLLPGASGRGRGAGSDGGPPGALELLERLESQAKGVGSAWALTVADRCRGVVLLAWLVRRDKAAALLERAAASFDELEHRPDAARGTLLALGQAHWRGGRRTLPATGALTQARDRFAAMGAVLCGSVGRPRSSRACHRPVARAS